MNAERRAAAIESVARATYVRVAEKYSLPDWDDAPQSWQEKSRDGAAAIIDAALSHLVGEPVEWIILNHYGAPAYSGIKDQEEALDRARRWNEGRPADSRYRVVALVGVDEDTP